MYKWHLIYLFYVSNWYNKDYLRPVTNINEKVIGYFAQEKCHVSQSYKAIIDKTRWEFSSGIASLEISHKTEDIWAFAGS